MCEGKDGERNVLTIFLCVVKTDVSGLDQRVAVTGLCLLHCLM